MTIHRVCSVDMLKTARVLANVGSDCGGMGYGQYGDPRRMGICEAWATVYGLRDEGLQTLWFFFEFMEGGRRVWEPPGCMWIWKMRLSGCRKNIAVTSTLLNTSKNPVDLENSYSLHVQLEATSPVTAVF